MTENVKKNEVRIGVIYGATSLVVDVRSVAETIADTFDKNQDGDPADPENESMLFESIHDYVGESLSDQEWPSFSLQIGDREDLVERVRAELVKMREED